MGKGPQYKARVYAVSCKATMLRLFIVAFAVSLCAHLSAQNMPLVAPVDSTLNSGRDSGSTMAPKDTITQSIASFDSTARDTTKHSTAKAFFHSPKKAAYLSAVLPGLGQAYNKKYWKIPIVYAGFAGFGVLVYYTSVNFVGYRAAYRSQEAAAYANQTSYASYNGISDAPTLKTYRDYYKKYMDIGAIGIVAWYMLNIIDATVDAHLMGWNMKNDLSLTWNPTVLTSPNYTSAAAGLTVALHF